LKDKGIDVIRMDLRKIGWWSVDWSSWLIIGTGEELLKDGDEPACSYAMDLVN
jgi:hypothetical protein